MNLNKEIEQIEKFVDEYKSQFNQAEDDYHFSSEIELIRFVLKRIKLVSERVI